MRTRRRTITTWSLACLLGLCAAAGVFALGRATAGGDAHAAREYARGHSDGVREGEAGGIREGRADQATDTVPPGVRDAAKAAFDSGYRAGADDVFQGYDGGWSYDVPYLITLARGGPGVTYRFASRTPLRPGVDYRLCSTGLCQEPHG